MNAGKLSERLILDQSVLTQIASGEQIVTFTQFKTVWAEADPQRGREQFLANQIVAETDTIWRIRWAADVDQMNPSWRLRNGSVIYDIKSIKHMNLGQREIWILATSGVNDG